MKDYVQEYFDRHAHAWVEAAYVGDVRFPVGAERVRLAIEGVAPAMREGARLVDLGCGGGQLCVHAARLGWSVAGVDSAPAMIEEARGAAGDVDVEWIVASYDDSALPGGGFDAVTAMGLIEYLDDDGALFTEAAGFRPVEVLALHPHPLPPALESLAPRVYNRLALAWQRPLERSPAGLAFCTAFVAVYERT